MIPVKFRLLILLPLSALSAPAQPGGQLDIGARPAVLGASYVAIADDGYAAYWNPAGLPLLRSQEINAMRSDLHRTGYIHSYLGYAVPFTDRFTAAADWSHQGFDDNELHFGQNRLGFAAGLRLTPTLSVGAGAKWFGFDSGLVDLGNPSGFSSKGSGWGFDLGVLFEAVPGFKLGVMAQDLNDAQITYENGVSEILYPRNLQLGAAYRLNRSLRLSTGIGESAQLGAEYRLHPALVLRGGVRRDLTDAVGTDFSFGAGLRHRFALLDYAFTQSPALGPTHRFSMGLAFNLSASAIKIQRPDLTPVFPALHKRYVQEPLGRVRLTNTSAKPLAANISLYIPEVMSDPTELSESVVIAPGTETVDLFALFEPRLSEWTRNRILPAEVEVAYTDGHRTRSSKKQGQVVVYNRNAVHWETIGAAAAFISAGEKTVAAFASSVLHPFSAAIKEGGRASRSLLRAMLLFNAISEHGVRYLADPNMPYHQLKGQDFVVDNVLYPAELLHKRAGDCDDGTVLYCALLENVGISTALIDAPGHILMAFDSGVPSTRAQQLGLTSDYYLERDGRVWIPVEVTLFGQSFHEAWRTAVEECQQLQREDRLEIADTRAAWKTYPPSDISFELEVTAPAKAQIDSSWAADWQQMRRIHEEYLEQNYLSALRQNPQRISLHNALIFNLLQLGDHDRALTQLALLEDRGAPLPMVENNRAVIRIMQGLFAEAAVHLERVLALNPADKEAAANLTLVHSRLGKQAAAPRQRTSETEPSGLRGESVELILEDMQWKE